MQFGGSNNLFLSYMIVLFLGWMFVKIIIAEISILAW